MDKVVRIGTAFVGERRASVYARIKYDGKRLSICGVEGPKKNGDCAGSCGQCLDEVLEVSDYAPGWTKELVERFVEIWDEWHLNDLRAACEHQRALGQTWKTHPLAECSVCGYKLGSAWLLEPVPDSVIQELEALPDTDQTPAWV